MYQSQIGTVNGYISEECNFTRAKLGFNPIVLVDNVYFKENVTVSAEIAFKVNAADVSSIGENKCKAWFWIESHPKSLVR